MFCKRDNLKPCQNITTELSKTKTTLSLRDVSEDAHIFNAVRAVLKCKQNRISRLEICGGLCTKKKKEFLSLLREIKHLSALCLVCHRLGPDMTRDLIRYVVEETKIRDLEISFDSTRCGISQGCSLKTSLSSIRHLSLRACNLIDLDPVLSLLLHPRLEELDLSDNPIELIRFVRRVLVLRDVRTLFSPSTARSNSHPTLKKKKHQVRFRVLRLQSISCNTSSYGNHINVLFESCTEELDLSRNKFLRNNVLCDHVAQAIRTDKVKLKTLRLDECDLTDRNLRSILSLKTSSSLHHLHVRSSSLQDKILFDRDEESLDIVTLFELRSLHISNLNMPNDAQSLIRSLQRGTRRRHRRDDFVLDLSGNVWTRSKNHNDEISKFTQRCSELARMFNHFILRVESWTLNENSRILERLWVTGNDSESSSSLKGRYSVVLSPSGTPFEFRWDTTA